MPYGYYGYNLDWTYILILISLLFSFIAQMKVSSTFKKYSRVTNARGLTGAAVARDILDKNGLYNVSIEHIHGKLSDHFDPRTNVVRLSDSVYNSTSVAALGVAAHEVGHAIQYAKGYTPIKIRATVIPATKFGSGGSYILLLLGFLFSMPFLIYMGIALFSIIVFFQLVTLPVEFNASSRALQTLKNDNILMGNELIGAKKMLSAAALTYVAAFITGLLQLIRLIAMANRRR